MRGGSRIAIEQMDVAMEEGLKMIARSRFFPLYSLCLFVPGALRPVAIWLAGAEIGSLFFYYAATPANLFQWTSALIFLTVSGLIWLVYGWSVMLGERANPTNIRVRTTLLFKVIRKGRSFEDVSPAELDDLFPEPKSPPADISLEQYQFWDRLLKRLGFLSLGLMFVFDAIWYSGIANAYIPALALSQPGTMNAAWLWLAQFLLFFTPLMAHFPIIRWMARRIRPGDRARFIATTKPDEARPFTLHDITLPDLINRIKNGSVDSYLSSKRLFRYLGFLSWWQEEFFPIPFIFIPFVSYSLFLITFWRLGSAYGISGSILGGMLSVVISTVATMALAGLNLLRYAPTRKIRADAIRNRSVQSVRFFMSQLLGPLPLSSSHSILARSGTTTRAFSSRSRSSWDSIMRREMLSGGRSDLAVCFSALMSRGAGVLLAFMQKTGRVG